MQLTVLKANGRNLARGCALLAIAGALAGCSSQALRFGDAVDGISTASTSNQRSIIDKQSAAQQPYPGDSGWSASAPSAPGGGYSSGTVSRSGLTPVTSQPLPQVSQAQPAATAPATPASPKVDRVATGTVKPAEKPFKSAEPEAVRTASAGGEAHGWSAVGGTVITVTDGETLLGLSRRFNVPAAAIRSANGLGEGGVLKSGQKIIIPARSKAGTTVVDAKPGKAPQPQKLPSDKVAVLPQQPKVKEGKAVPPADAAANAKDPVAKPQLASAAGQANTGTYTVQQGDTLSAISRKTGVSVAALKQANGMNDGLVRIGQTLKLSGAGAAPAAAPADAAAKPAAVDPVQTASTPQQQKTTPTETVASYTPPKKAEKVISQAEDDNVAAPDSTGIGKMRWPARGRVIAGFGKGSDGIDISVPEGTPIKAAENGVVIYAGDGLKEFGNTVLVRHEDGLVTVYGHASSLGVKRGQKVKRGQEIAVSGMSGSTDAPKLHFEVRKNSSPVDPNTYLE
ncbi:peptidoglycan DD-metalloendopeptidase family protein [Mesorhizobium sp. SP-1A]|uniref:peptidoglycan DD-metalloendopeptidase family protein n=1 Tax=Mesorhizobium sp. SP-1A TaxID=3077840 RepID=UPI0028F74F06|nr:peptidoglycan DD-metalloendopeptidase family protein [Mesorhizobium sp. SP-1A]